MFLVRFFAQIISIDDKKLILTKLLIISPNLFIAFNTFLIKEITSVIL